jgi:hypothetical protein
MQRFLNWYLLNEAVNTMSKYIFLPMIIILVAFFSAILVGFDSGWFLRPYLLFLFVFICPGMAVIGLLHLNNFLTEFVLSIALSLVLGALVAELLVVLQQWSPPLVLAILVLISFIGASLQIVGHIKTAVSARG